MNKNGCGNCLLMYIIYYSRNWQHLLGSSMLPWPLFAIVFAPDIVADNKEPDSVYDNGYQNRRRRPHPSQCVTLGVTGGLCGVALATKGRARVLRGSGLPETGFEAWNGPRWVCIHTYHNIKYMMYIDVLVPTRKKTTTKITPTDGCSYASYAGGASTGPVESCCASDAFVLRGAAVGLGGTAGPDKEPAS